MTGTPIQNSLDDLVSLVQFLRVPQLEVAAVFHKHITRRRTAGRIARPNYGNLKLLLGSICLRRSTSSILSSLGITSVDHRPSFSPAERAAYDGLVNACERSIKAAINNRPTKKSSRCILTAMLRLRIFCNMGLSDPTIAIADADVEGHFLPDEEISLLLQSGASLTCSKCKTEVIAPDLGDGSLGQHKGSRPSLKCAICIEGDQDTTGATVSPLPDGDPMEGVEVEDLPSRVSTADGGSPDGPEVVYPSKLVALLADIKEHYTTDKRYGQTQTEVRHTEQG